MKISIILVSSLNGYMTNGKEGSRHWASAEDQVFFTDQVLANNLIVMGRQTYCDSREMIRSRLSPNRRRIVLTRQPQEYIDQAVPGQLEFSSEQPPKLIARLDDLGYTGMLVVGGSEINSLFLQHQVVNYLLVTLEPVLFNNGIPITSTISDLCVPLHLIESKQLNPQGTLLLKYQVKKS